MTLYKLAQGSDVAIGSLIALIPQPKSDGIKPLRRTFSGDGSIYDEGRYIELYWDLVGNQPMYQALLVSVFGVSYLSTNEVTIFCPDEHFQFQRFNGLAVIPQNGEDVRRRDYFIRDIVILIKDLVLAS